MKKIVVRSSLLHSSDEGRSLELVSGRRKHARQRIAQAIQHPLCWRSSCSVSALVCAGKVFLPLSVVHSAFIRESARLARPVLRGPFRRQWGVLLTGDYRPQFKPERALVHVAATLSNREDAETFLRRDWHWPISPSLQGYSAEELLGLFELDIQVIELMIDRSGIVLAAVPDPAYIHEHFFFLRPEEGD